MKGIKNLYLSRNFFIFSALIVFLFVMGYFYSMLLGIGKVIFVLFVILIIVDLILLYRGDGVEAGRHASIKLSNGDYNKINIQITNNYGFPVLIQIIDELPVQFQKRDFVIDATVKQNETIFKSYNVKPVERGEYHFGSLNIYVCSVLGLVMRRFRFEVNNMMPVYPSILQMQKYEFFAISNRLTEVGVKRMRRIGASMEFDQIRNYIAGDDYRKINWKATARKNNIMVNQYREERSQHIYSIIDMGRVMRMPFESMSLLDYAINTSLAISNVVIRKEDKAGVITFSHEIDKVLPADRKSKQIFNILELLYNSKTDFLESNYEKLYSTVSRTMNQRSLILLFTNFESLVGMKRHMKYLTMIAKKHFLVIIFFENTELADFIKKPVNSVEKIYTKTIAEKFAYEKKLITKELDRHGIHSILTSPDNLTINTINKYIEIKARGLI